MPLHTFDEEGNVRNTLSLYTFDEEWKCTQ